MIFKPRYTNYIKLKLTSKKDWTRILHLEILVRPDDDHDGKSLLHKDEVADLIEILQEKHDKM